jgi:hypothetical protein
MPHPGTAIVGTLVGSGLASTHCPYAESEARIARQEVPVFFNAGGAVRAFGGAMVRTRAGEADTRDPGITALPAGIVVGVAAHPPVSTSKAVTATADVTRMNDPDPDS